LRAVADEIRCSIQGSKTDTSEKLAKDGLVSFLERPFTNTPIKRTMRPHEQGMMDFAPGRDEEYQQ